MEEFKEQLKDKSIEKKVNILKILIEVSEKEEKIKTDIQGTKIVKLVLSLLDEND